MRDDGMWCEGAIGYQQFALCALVDCLAPVVTLVAKSDIRHVEKALRTTPEENLAMIGDSVRFFKEHAKP